MSLSDSLNSLRGTAAVYAAAAKKKAGLVAGIAKLNVSVLAEEDKVKKAEAELGRLYYHDFVSGNGADTEAYLPVCNRITESKSTIASMKAEIDRLKSELSEDAAVDSEAVTDEDFEPAQSEAEPEEDPDSEP